MKILVTGGAGYVGSHAARLLDRAGHDVWIYDNLCRGHRAAALPQRLILGGLEDRELLRKTLAEKGIEAVMHFAGLTLVGEAATDPGPYYRNNVAASLSLLEAMREVGVGKIVFSSSTATYGAPARVPVSEERPKNRLTLMASRSW